MEDKLNEKITALKDELEQISINDSATKEHINTLINEIESMGNNPEENQSVSDNIKSAIDRFETEHPRATAILNDIMVTLSNMGI